MKDAEEESCCQILAFSGRQIVEVWRLSDQTVLSSWEPFIGWRTLESLLSIFMALLKLQTSKVVPLLGLPIMEVGGMSMYGVYRMIYCPGTLNLNDL